MAETMAEWQERMRKNAGFQISLTFTYSRDVFRKDKFQEWITELFGEDVRFDGFEYGRSYPTIKVGFTDFEEQKHKIPTENLVKIKGSFNTVERLALGVWSFSNDLRESKSIT